MSDVQTVIAARDVAVSASQTASDAADFAAEKAVEVNADRVATQTAKTEAETARDDAEAFAAGFGPGTATTLAPGATPTIDITGPAGAKVLDLGIPAAVADDDSMTAVAENPTTDFAQHLSTTIETEVEPLFGQGDLLPAIGAVETETPSVVFLNTSDGVAYGYDATTVTQLKKSTDDGATWTLVHDFTGAGAPVALVELDDGEALCITFGAVYRSTGWSINPTTATWAVTVTPSQDDAGYARANFIASVFDAWGQYVLLGEYTTPRRNSRRVRLSTDYGATWTTVFDLNVQYPSDIDTVHIHGVGIDGFKTGTPRLWFTHGDGPRGIFYSDNLGANWTMMPGTDASNFQFMTVTATPSGMVLTTDSNAPDGVWRILRTPVAADMVLENILKIPYVQSAGSLLGFGTRSWRDPDTNLVWVTFQVITPSAAGSPEVPGYVFVSDGLRATKAWTSRRTSTNPTPVVPDGIGITSSGALLVAYKYGVGNTQVFVKATQGGRGGRSFEELNAGNALTGVSTGRTSVAIGAYTTARGQTVAIGAKVTLTDTNGTTPLAVAIGNEATTGTQTVAIGAGVSSPYTYSTAVGYLAATTGLDSVAIGKAASAGPNSVVVGSGASAANTNSTVVGKGITAGAFNGVTAVGQGTTVGATNATALGISAAASGNDSTALGSLASATGTSSIAAGKSAAAAGSSSVAIGASASTSSSAGTVAVGQSASAAASDALALGHSATAGFARSVALGSSTTVTAADQVMVGGRHIALLELAADPSAAAADGARLYIKDDGAGKTQLCVRFSTGAVQVIASQP